MKSKIQISQLSLSRSGQRVINGISFELNSSEWLCVLGANGSGKTSLLLSLLGILPIDEGQISINDLSIDRMNRNEIARQIALVPANSESVSVSLSVYDVVEQGCFSWPSDLENYEEEKNKRIKNVIEQMDLENLSDKWMSHLSTGEKQRLMIARALVQNSPFLFLDEPTSNLDLKHQFELLKYLTHLRDVEKKGILMVSHDLYTFPRFCDRIIVLGDKKILAQGKPSEILNSEFWSDYFGLKRADLDHYFPFLCALTKDGL